MFSDPGHDSAGGARGAMTRAVMLSIGSLVRRRKGLPSLASPLGWLVLAALTAAVWSPSTGARAAELVMFESPYCEWCEAWDQDVGVVYHKTEEGRLAPLRRVQQHAPLAEDLGAVRAIVYTPTFVLVDRGREVGRITGYPGEDHFWGLLGVLLRQLATSPGT